MPCTESCENISPKEEFLRSLAQGQAGALLPKSLVNNFVSLSILNDISPALKPLQDLKNMNDPQGIYVQCLDCVAPEPIKIDVSQGEKIHAKVRIIICVVPVGGLYGHAREHQTSR